MKKNIIVMNLLVLLFWMSMNIYMPNLPAYAQSLGANAAMLGIIGGVYGIAMVVVRIPLGLVTDNSAKRKRLLVIGSAVLVLSCGMLVVAGNTSMIAAGRMLAGASGAWWVTQNATYANYFSEEGQLKAQGVLAASMNWGKLAAALIGGLVVQFMGIHPVFIIALMIAAACIILSLQLKDTGAEIVEKKTLIDLLPVLKNPDLMKLTLMAIFINIMCFSAPIIFTMLAAKDLGASSLDMGLLNVVFFLAAALTSLFAGTRAYRKIGGI
ncbi:MAG: MFS transporter, partial [Eubacteriales bacterium]